MKEVTLAAPGGFMRAPSYVPGPLKHFLFISPVAHCVCASIAGIHPYGVIKPCTMIEYLLMIAFLCMTWLLFKAGCLRSKKWFVLLTIVLTLGTIAFLLVDSPGSWNLRKTLLLILIVGSAIFTIVKRALWYK